MTTQETHAILLSTFHFNPETGVFTRLVDGELCGHNRNRPSAKAGAVAGYIAPTGYGMVRVGSKTYRAHRLAWLYVHGEWPSGLIDHIDGNKANNAVFNLREANHSQNQQNRRDGSSRGALGLLGVSYRKKSGKYGAQIKHAGRAVWLGEFPTAAAASAAYWAAKRSHHAYCAA